MNSQSPPAAAPAAVPAPAAAGTWWQRIDRALERIGDRLNPILVKETRQALKSRQFVVTFGLVLLAVLMWSIGRLATYGPEVHYASLGPEVFAGYFVILAFPLLVVVPFGAYRSLVSERENGTFDLLSITALEPRQIVRGKLGSAVLQMVVYLSALVPCLAFTYMLGGIDLLTIGYVVVATVLGSLGLSMIGLVCATVTDQKHWQIAATVVLIAGLVYLFVGVCMLVIDLLERPELQFASPRFWKVHAALLTAYASYFALAYYAAAAKLTFANANRSTRLRVTMLVQYGLFAGWIAYFIFASPRPEVEWLELFCIGSVVHWYVMGVFLTGEPSELSPRVRRQLPQTGLGRMFLTWFNPGPGTGYMFAVCGAAGAYLLSILAIVAVAPGVWAWRFRDTHLISAGLLAVSYLAMYLGVGLLLLKGLRRVAPVWALTAGLVHVLVFLAAVLVPVLIHFLSPGVRESDYTLLQIPNAVWTLAYALGRRYTASYVPALVIVVPLLALVVVAANMPGIVREIRRVRLPKPPRVAEDDAELAARLAPPAPPPERTSPWDD